MIVNLLFFHIVLAGVNRNAGFLKYGFFLSIPLMIIGGIALLVTIIKFVKMYGDSQIASVPLRANNEVLITKDGVSDVCLQVPSLSFFTGGELDYRLLNQNTGQAVQLSEKSARSMSRRNSFSTITFPVRTFQAVPGKYLLQVAGLNPQTDYSGYSLIIEKSVGSKAVIYILGLILTGGMAITGFVLTIVSLNVR